MGHETTRSSDPAGPGRRRRGRGLVAARPCAVEGAGGRVFGGGFVRLATLCRAPRRDPDGRDHGGRDAGAGPGRFRGPVFGDRPVAGRTPGPEGRLHHPDGRLWRRRRGAGGAGDGAERRDRRAEPDRPEGGDPGPGAAGRRPGAGRAADPGAGRAARTGAGAGHDRASAAVPVPRRLDPGRRSGAGRGDPGGQGPAGDDLGRGGHGPGRDRHRRIGRSGAHARDGPGGRPAGRTPPDPGSEPGAGRGGPGRDGGRPHPDHRRRTVSPGHGGRL
jgi:hypothetical protein